MSSKKKLLFLFTIYLFFCFIFISDINAAVIINEFSPSTNPEWVELYNDGDTSVDLTNYLLEDGNAIKTDDLILSGTIVSKGFLIFERTDGWLNNGGDTIKLYNNASPSEIIDEYSYGSVDSLKSVARIPNGSENWEVISNITKNSINPTPTPSPSSTPIPTQEPTTAPTSIPTSNPTITPTSKPTPTKSPTPKPTQTPTETPDDLVNTAIPILVGLSGSTSTPESLVAGASTSKKSPVFSIILVISGLSLMTFGGINLYKKMKTEYNSKNESS